MHMCHGILSHMGDMRVVEKVFMVCGYSGDLNRKTGKATR